MTNVYFCSAASNNTCLGIVLKSYLSPTGTLLCLRREQGFDWGQEGEPPTGRGDLG